MEDERRDELTIVPPSDPPSAPPSAPLSAPPSAPPSAPNNVNGKGDKLNDSVKWVKKNRWMAMTIVLIIFIIVFMIMMYVPTPLNSGFVPRLDDPTAWSGWLFGWMKPIDAGNVIPATPRYA